jgi:type IX secretion system PorP/SprF family membrane protein
MKRILYTFIALTIAVSSNAQQDYHFSQFYSSPTWINPAAVGFFEGNMQFFSTYRGQWNSVTPNAFRTIVGSMEGRPFEDKFSSGFLGASFGFFNDIAANGNFNQNGITMSFNYAIELQDDHYLALGLSPTFNSQRVNFNNFTWNEQWNGTEFDQSAFTGEPFYREQHSFFDVNSGLYYHGKFSDEMTIFGGISAMHVIRPRIQFDHEDELLYRRFNLHGGGVFGIKNTKIMLAPNFLATVQGPNSMYNVGIDFMYLLQEKSKHTGYFNKNIMSIGTYVRPGDAFYAALAFHLSSFSFGVNYDLNLSKLSNVTNGNGAMEMFLRYRTYVGGKKGHKSKF